MKNFNIKRIIDDMNRINLNKMTPYEKLTEEKKEQLQEYTKRFTSNRLRELSWKYFVRYYSENQNKKAIAIAFLPNKPSAKDIENQIIKINKSITSCNQSSLYKDYITIIESTDDYAKEFISFQTLPFAFSGTRNALKKANILTNYDLIKLILKHNEEISVKDILIKNIPSFGEKRYIDLENTYKDQYRKSIESLLPEQPKKFLPMNATEEIPTTSKETLTKTEEIPTKVEDKELDLMKLFESNNPDVINQLIKINKKLFGYNEEKMYNDLENRKTNQLLEQLNELSKPLKISPWTKNELKNNKTSYIAIKQNKMVLNLERFDDTWTLRFEYTSDDIKRDESHPMCFEELQTYTNIMNYMNENMF